MFGRLLLGAAAWVSLGLMIASSPASAQQAPVEGVWLTMLKSEITIAPCPEGYCGTLSKIVVPEEVMEKNRDAIENMSVEEYTDENNKDPKLRSRPILGLRILTLTPSDKPLIYDGEIYNPEDGNTYSGYVEVLDGDRIKLNGCVLFNVICRGEEWTRVPS